MCDKILLDMSSTLIQCTEVSAVLEKNAQEIEACVTPVYKTHHRKGASSWFLSGQRIMHHTASSSLYTKHTCTENIHQCAVLDTDSSPTPVNRKGALGLTDLVKVFHFVHCGLELHSFECIFTQANITLCHFVKN